MKQNFLKQIIKEEIASLLKEGLEGPVMGVDHKKARSEQEASQLEKQGYQRVDKRNPSYKYRDEKGEYIPLVKKLNEKKKFPDLTGDGKVTKADILKARGVKLKEESFKRNPKGTDNPDHSKEFYEAEKLLLQGLTSVLGKRVSFGGDLETNEGDFEMYSADILVDTDAEIAFGEKDGNLYMGVHKLGGWLVKPREISSRNVMNYAIDLATKYKTELMPKK